jgi:AAA+ ATPase superfamily predicted ATPase
MFVAREDERRLLINAYESDRSQFVAIYGRLHVGKTFLVRETFNDVFTF